MKKYLLIMLCIFSMLTHAAESKTIMCLTGNTLFLISRDDIHRHGRALDVMIVGKREQDRFKKSAMQKEYDIIGTAFCVHDKKIYALPKTSGSSSQDDSYKAFTKDYKLYKKAKAEEVQGSLVHVIEPIIVLKDLGKHRPQAYSYSPYRVGAENPYAITCHNYLGDTALEQAGNDLAMCYQNALVKCLELIKNKENKSIGLVTLSTERGFPREQAALISFKAVTGFLEKHSADNMCSFVHLFVRKHSELKRYKELMMEYNEKYKK